MKSFYIANFGCRASQSEGAAVEQELTESAAQAASSPYQASVVVVNSCTVTEEADREVRQLIRRIASRNPEAQIIVTGCYAQRAPADLAELPKVRYVVGNSHKPMLGSLTLKVLNEEFAPNGRAEVFCSNIFLEHELKPTAFLGSGGRTRAIVKVQDGCNANCSFCVIPSVRGRSRSMNPELVVDEVREMVRRGYKEVVFSGIHLGTYGRDLFPKTSFGELIVRLLDDVPELERLRLSSIEPVEVTREIIGLVAHETRMAHHLHIPLQSGSRRVLREMRRPYTPLYYEELMHEVRSRIEDAAIGADVMVGFPGETDEEFAETYRLIERAPLTYLHVFPYSPRPGTPAADIPNPIPSHVSQFRAKALRQLIANKNEAFRKGMIGRALEVLVLQSEEGLSSNFLRVQVAASLSPNQWVNVRIADISKDGLESQPGGDRSDFQARPHPGVRGSSRRR